MGYDREYDGLLRTAEEAVGLIEPGDDVIAGMAAGEPAALIEAMGGHEGFSANRASTCSCRHTSLRWT